MYFSVGLKDLCECVLERPAIIGKWDTIIYTYVNISYLNIYKIFRIASHKLITIVNQYVSVPLVITISVLKIRNFQTHMMFCGYQFRKQIKKCQSECWFHLMKIEIYLKFTIHLYIYYT